MDYFSDDQVDESIVDKTNKLKLTLTNPSVLKPFSLSMEYVALLKKMRLKAAHWISYIFYYCMVVWLVFHKRIMITGSKSKGTKPFVYA